jgi:hypothetical protein
MLTIPLLCLCILPSASLYYSRMQLRTIIVFFFLRFMWSFELYHWTKFLLHVGMLTVYFSGLFSHGSWSLGFWLQVQMICHYGVCTCRTCIVVLFSQRDWIVYSCIYPYYILGFVGELRPDKNGENGKHFLFTHKSITIQYNKDQVYGSWTSIWLSINVFIFFYQC